MIIQLSKGKLKIDQMPRPEQAVYVFLEYVFEPSTNHLTPKLTINNKSYIGNRVYINMDIELTNKSYPIRVDLLNGSNNVVYTYTGNATHTPYILFGRRPVRPDYEDHVYQLTETIEALQARIQELEEEGDVI
jgi:hypothetical protein